MTSFEIKSKISESLKLFQKEDLKTSAEKLLNTLGYSSNKKADIDLKSLKIRASEHNIEKVSYALWNEWISASLVFQITAEEIRQNTSLSDFNTVEDDLMQSYLFFTIELRGNYYTRGQLSGITRFMNRLYDMPVMVLFRYGSYITFAIINRRPCKIDSEKSVLEKITLIKDVSIEVPHRAHIEILYDLSLEELQRRHGFSDFMGLHEAWQKTLDTKELNKQFYQKLFNWYLWTLRQVKFPQIRPKDEMIPDNVHQSESLIRLLTRLLFVWFMKEKGLITPDLFDHKKLKSILKNFKGNEGSETIYYKAILQNLFFATLNRKIEQRKPIDKKKFPNPEYGDPLVYRYEDLFIHPDNILTYFKDIPFLNGGLFDCLDQKKDGENKEEIRLDGFSTKKEKQPVFPDKLFFGEYNDIDLSTDYDDKKKNHQTVFGLIDILQQYKFTIEENTPVEEEVALDPELLGKVFENLLASYNPETQTTARKQTGSFYTPREIVNYMVDESLIAYLKNHVDDEERLRKLFSYENGDNGNPFDERETGILLKAIDNCKILDPACGSGAFPMGVLQKMIHILHKLDHDNSKWFEMVINNFPPYMQSEVRKKLEKENWNYVRKLGIIQQCIYGVDIQPIATQIAKLRFFISLLVDQKEKPGEDNRGFEPLPNLDFKIVTANTLIPAPASDEIITDLFSKNTDPFFEEFDKLTALYFSTYDTDKKKDLKNQIMALIAEKCNQKIKEIESKFEHPDENASKALKVKYKKFIEEREQEVKLWKSYANLFKYESVGFFEPKYFFPKAKDGFDVVIGNPPYIFTRDADFTNEFKELISKNYFSILTSRDKKSKSNQSGKINLFALFILRGLFINQKKGTLVYIVPNNLLRTTIYDLVRKFLIENYRIEELVDLGSAVFDNVTASTIIIQIGNNKPLKNDKSKVITNILDIAKHEYNVTEIEQSQFLKNVSYTISLFADERTNNLLRQISESKSLLGDFCTEIIEGIVAKKCLISKTKTKDAQPLLEGKTIKRYRINPVNKYIIWKEEEIHRTRPAYL